MSKLCRAAAVAVLLLSTTLATASEDMPSPQPPDPDPWEGFNRSMFEFNDFLDRYAFKPLAQGYRYVMPDLAERGVSNFFNNLKDVETLANNLMQLKFQNAASDTGRIVLNSTFGLVGFVDLATPLGLERHDEDFGQTLGYWGVPSGNYLVLPFFGPSTVRDGISIVPDMYLDPVGGVDHVRTRNTLYGIRLIDTRAKLLQAESLISGDRYLFIRDAYLQRREFQINDGRSDNEFNPEDF